MQKQSLKAPEGEVKVNGGCLEKYYNDNTAVELGKQDSPGCITKRFSRKFVWVEAQPSFRQPALGLRLQGIFGGQTFVFSAMYTGILLCIHYVLYTED